MFIVSNKYKNINNYKTGLMSRINTGMLSGDQIEYKNSTFWRLKTSKTFDLSHIVCLCPLKNISTYIVYNYIYIYIYSVYCKFI